MEYFKPQYMTSCLSVILLMFSNFVNGQTSSELTTATPTVSEQHSSPHSQPSAESQTLAQNQPSTRFLLNPQSSVNVLKTTGKQNTQPPSTTSTPNPLLPKVTHQNSSDDPKIQALMEQFERLKLQNAVLSLQNLIQTEKYQQALLAVQHEKDNLLLNNELQLEKARQEWVQLMADQEKLLLENEFQSAQQQQILAKLETLKTHSELENYLHEQEHKKTLAKLESEREQLAMQNALLEEKNKQEELKIQLKTAQLNFEIAQFEFEKTQKGLDMEELAEKISAREQIEFWESQVNSPKQYLKEPFINDHLIISDRKIELEEVIFPGTAAYVNERIHFYNNKTTEYPIFLVIDTCYGGSVMEGSKILEAMKASRAPVYVVVKSLAASMAAVITTLAERSYAYPNAVIVHHQLWTGAIGNQREIEEQLEMAKNWTKRIMYPVAEKMGLSMEELVKKMYEKNSIGDWYEFADVAIKLKWVDTVVKDIRDTSFKRQPVDTEDNEEDMMLLGSGLSEKLDQQGQHYLKLPRLNPLDFYFVYNPDNYYR
ncbi:MAG TPA: peptidase S14 [Thiotrichaceae bacterium]|nr:peptidase S14 [Thiotrichaceae bacterium]